MELDLVSKMRVIRLKNHLLKLLIDIQEKNSYDFRSIKRYSLDKSKNKRLILVNNSEDVINGLETLVKKEYKDSIFIHDHVKLDQALDAY